jgi:ubiquinone/menaquinone biosynthesis C-methylase UbiE
MRENWDQFYKLRGRFYLKSHPELQKVVSRFKKRKIRKVIDLGCGSGSNSIALAMAGFSVTGVDYSKESIKLAQKWAQSENLEIDFLFGDFSRKLHFNDNAFSGALAIDCLQYDSIQVLKSALSELGRIVRYNGSIFIVIPTTVNQPLMTHLVFTEKEIRHLVQAHFQIEESFYDTKKNLCLFLQNKILKE